MTTLDPNAIASATREAREWLAALLSAALAPLVVTATKPAELAVPCTFLDITQRRTDTAEGMEIVLVFPVVTIVDGDDSSQVLMLDVLADVLYGAVFAAGCVATSTIASQINVGGPSLRSCVTYVEIPLRDITFCYPPFTEFDPPT